MGHLMTVGYERIGYITAPDYVDHESATIPTQTQGAIRMKKILKGSSFHVITGISSPEGRHSVF